MKIVGRRRWAREVSVLPIERHLGGWEDLWHTGGDGGDIGGKPDGGLMLWPTGGVAES